MKHKCKITVLRKECYKDLQEEYLTDPQSGVCPFFEVGQEFTVDRDDFPTCYMESFVRKRGTQSAVTFIRHYRTALSWKGGQRTKK